MTPPKIGTRYKLVAFDSNDVPRILGYGTRAEVRQTLTYIRAHGLPGYRYFMARDKA